MAYTEDRDIREMMDRVLSILESKRYDPINQITGYILSGDPSYITFDARSRIQKFERDDILIELLKSTSTADPAAAC